MSKRRNLIGRMDLDVSCSDGFVTVRPRLTTRKSRITRMEHRVGTRYHEGLAQNLHKPLAVNPLVTEVVEELVDPQITCLFCKIPESVFPSPTIKGRWDCKNCSAYFLDRDIHLNAGKERGVLQDFSTMYMDKKMGCVIVFKFQGDISPETVEKAQHFKAALQVSPMEGFNQLTKDFISRLWCLTGGKPYLDDEVIFEACRSYAYEQSADDEHERLSQMLFAQNVIGKIDSHSLRALHEVIAAIPKSNGNLMRYYIAEGQEEFILLGLRKVYEQAVNDGQAYTAKLAQGLCR